MMDYNPDQCPVCEGPMKDWQSAAPWQPIETAPKDADDCVLLATLDDDGAVYLSVAFYEPAEGLGVGQNAGPGWFVYPSYGLQKVIGVPTHWMPLPEPPTASEAQQTGSVEP